MDHFLVHLGKRASAVFGSSNVILGGARQLLEGLSIVFFKAGSFFEKSAKLLSNYHQLLIRLSCLSHMVSELQLTAWSNAGCHVKKGPPFIYVCRTNWLTFAEAMLCFKRCSSEGIPCYRGKSASTSTTVAAPASALRVRIFAWRRRTSYLGRQHLVDQLQHGWISCRQSGSLVWRSRAIARSRIS